MGNGVYRYICIPGMYLLKLHCVCMHETGQEPLNGFS